MILRCSDHSGLFRWALTPTDKCLNYKRRVKEDLRQRDKAHTEEEVTTEAEI
jgi:hypothetical protein